MARRIEHLDELTSWVAERLDCTPSEVQERSIVIAAEVLRWADENHQLVLLRNPSIPTTRLQFDMTGLVGAYEDESQA